MNDELKRRVGRVREKDILSGHVWFGTFLSYALEFGRKTVIFLFWGSCKRFTCTGGGLSLFSRCFQKDVSRRSMFLLTISHRIYDKCAVVPVVIFTSYQSIDRNQNDRLTDTISDDY